MKKSLHAAPKEYRKRNASRWLFPSPKKDSPLLPLELVRQRLHRTLLSVICSENLRPISDKLDALCVVNWRAPAQSFPLPVERSITS